MKVSENGGKWMEMVFGHFVPFCFVFDHFAPFVKGGLPFYLENADSLKEQTVCGYFIYSSFFTY